MGLMVYSRPVTIITFIDLSYNIYGHDLDREFSNYGAATSATKRFEYITTPIGFFSITTADKPN